jgi:hypothetical protein
MVLKAVVTRYVEFLNGRGKWLVLLLWTGVVCMGAAYALKFLGVTSMSFSPPAGSASARAHQRLAATFPSVGNSINLAVVVDSLNAQQTVDCPQVCVCECVCGCARPVCGMSLQVWGGGGGGVGRWGHSLGLPTFPHLVRGAPFTPPPARQHLPRARTFL